MASHGSISHQLGPSCGNSIDNSNGREGLAPVPDPPRVRGVRMKKLARAKAKDRQASSSVTGSLQDVDSSQDDDSTTSAQVKSIAKQQR